MQRKITNDDFEHFLKKNADQLRMYPSTDVWKNISKDMHRKNRRVFGWLFLLVSFLSGGFFMLNYKAEPATEPLAANPDQTNNAVPAQETPVFHLPQQNKTQPKATSKNTTARIVKAGPEKTRTTQAGQTPVSAANNIDAPVAPDPSSVAPADARVHQPAPAVPLLQEAGSQPLLPRPNDQPAISLAPAESHLEPILKRSGEKGESTDVYLLTNSREKKLTWQLFLTPTISYRKLSDNKSFSRPVLTTSIPYNVSALYNINNAVTHKPDLGLEFGLGVKYRLAKNLKLRSGFQFNINRYAIKAFSYVPEMATIALRNGYHIDSVSTITNYRNFNGGKSNWLQNLYFQASVPVGMELKVHGSKKMYVGVASTVQPTYIIGERAYLITADYKNYAKAPWLVRRWNVAANLETFVSYTSGKTQWQIGPQVRYQMLSSFISEYPVKENLFDFGLKVGVTLNQYKK